MYLQVGIFKTGVTQMFSFAKKGKATVIRYLVTVLRDRERRSFLHLLRSFFFLGLLYISSYSIGSGGQENVRQGSLATRYGLRLPPLRFLYLTIFLSMFLSRIFLISFILRKPQNLKFISIFGAFSEYMGPKYKNFMMIIVIKYHFFYSF